MNTERTLTDHHDGHGLNEKLLIISDAPDQSGAAHNYEIVYDGHGIVATIQFQKGPRNVDGSTPGITEAALLTVLIDRLRGFQTGPYPCRENEQILTELEGCLTWTKERAHARAARGVLGTNTK